MTLWYLAAAVGLLLANGFFVAVEFALIAARSSKLEHLAEQGNRRASIALRASRETSFMLAGTQLGITMASLGLGFVAEPAVGHLIESALGATLELGTGAERVIGAVLGLAIVVFFHMVVGEMAPKNVSISEPERSALWLAFPYRIYAVIFRPLIVGLNYLARLLLGLIGIEQRDSAHSVYTREQIGFMITESAKGGQLDVLEHRLLSGAIAFGNRDAGSVMVPRTEMTAFPLTITPRAIEAEVLRGGHSRFPIFGDDLDHILGFFHAKDLLKVDDPAWDLPLDRSLVRPMLVVPESRRLHPLLRDMRRERSHFALVIDEHGGTAGIVTLEDLLEELVGEILDEYDEDETSIERFGSQRFLVPGTLRIDEASTRLGVRLPDGEYETVAGLVMDRLGRIPVRRDQVAVDGWILRVRSMYRRRVLQVLIEPDPHARPLPGDAGGR